MMPNVRMATCFAIGVMLVGCGKTEKPRLAVFPVSGKLFINGKPASRADVALRPLTPLAEPANRSVLPHGFVAADGAFHIGTYTDNDGAPPGEYAVTIVWPKITVEGGEEIFGPDRLNGYYNNPQRPVAKVTVTEGDNIIPPLELRLR